MQTHDETGDVEAGDAEAGDAEARDAEAGDAEAGNALDFLFLWPSGIPVCQGPLIIVEFVLPPPSG